MMSGFEKFVLVVFGGPPLFLSWYLCVGILIYIFTGYGMPGFQGE